ncbi:DUF4091 domain-containing protein [Mariniphaga sediminis]|uniref:DUF4091 domain-containing protein n=1 Tax=Mariniphaga sediminis TaxID=1628158 RepID=A0A399D8X9_9BACT|nr:DUF4091 domain-containing protein [Mariniphaga sediminis]RIH66911.1 DUF4091 domain-containing protein [Mariniphaga sediminis]
MIRAFLLICVVFTFVLSAGANGLLVENTPECKIWWAVNTSKIMRDAPVPDQKGKIQIQAARNEYEGFQVVLSPLVEFKNISVSITDFTQKGDEVIPAANIKIRQVEYVHVTKPSGKYHKTGWYPDPLPLYEKPFDAKAETNTPLWFTVKVPENATPGIYKAVIKFATANWEASIPVELKVWDFSMPEVPHIRSAFNLYSGLIHQYHNLETKEELKQVLDLYYQSFKEYRISPQEIFDQYPISKSVKGVKWAGGTFDPDTVFEGRYSYQVNDNSVRANIEGRAKELIEVTPEKPYLLKWWAKTLEDGQKYFVSVKSYDANKEQIHWHLQGTIYDGSVSWKQDSLLLDPENPILVDRLIACRPIPAEAKYVSVQFYPVVPFTRGELTGVFWMDNLSFTDVQTGENLLPHGDFEQNMDELDLEIDFTEFNYAAHKYLDGYGFTGFRFKVPELREGAYYGRKAGWFGGFVNGTDEYKKLISRYLGAFQQNLEKNGWLGKEYLYWVDEPKHEDYEFVREGMKTIHAAAPKLKRFITENNPGPEIMDVTDIGCPVLIQFNPEKSKKWMEQGREMWSYLMCWPKDPHVNLFIDADAINMRMWLWMSYRYNLTGILVWSANVWNAEGCSPPGILQNIWEDPMTYKDSYGAPVGGGMEFGNGDGMFFYPPNRDPNNDKTKYLRGPVPSVRLEILREGIDDYDYMMMLEKYVESASPNQKGLVKKARQLLHFGDEVFTSDRVYTKNPEVLMNYRKQMGELLEKFSSAK